MLFSNNTRENITHEHHQMANIKIRLIIFFADEDRKALYSQQKQVQPGADCGSDHELLIAKFRLKLKKVGKTTRSFRYDLNQIPYNYTGEVMTRFQGLYLVEMVPKELWMEVHNIVQEAVTKIQDARRQGICW